MTSSKVYIFDSYLWQCGLHHTPLLKESLPLEKDTHTLYIDPLQTDWHSPLLKNHFRSGCAPIEALEEAFKLLSNGTKSIVKISGRDFLKSEYTSSQRRELMEIYGPNENLPKAYSDLTEYFLSNSNIHKDDYFLIRDELINNYKLTLEKLNKDITVSDKWYTPLTPYLRGVDCANPHTDFHGELYLVNEDFLKSKNLQGQFTRVLKVQTKTLKDGPSHIKEVSTFKHLQSLYNSLSERLDITIKEEVLNKNCLLDIYSCFPVVPLAFLNRCFSLTSKKDIEMFLKENQITLNGGMNFSKGPWNNPCLSSLIHANLYLKERKEEYALIHGNGGLGYKQGIAILKRERV